MLRFYFSPSPDLKKQHYIETGENSMDQYIVVDDKELTPEQRARILQSDVELGKLGIHPRPTRESVTRKIGDLEMTRHDMVLFKMLDIVPTAQQAIEMYCSLADQVAPMLETIETRKAERLQQAAERKARELEIINQRAEREAIEKTKREARHAARVEAANTIAWDENDKAIIDLQDALFIISGDEQDQRFNNWCKVVEAVEERSDNGYDFVGPFVQDGTIEIERKFTVFLVASVNGSRKYNLTTYRIIVLNPETGKLELTDITTNNDKRGWALRIRDQVRDLLK